MCRSVTLQNRTTHRKPVLLADELPGGGHHPYNAEHGAVLLCCRRLFDSSFNRRPGPGVLGQSQLCGEHRTVARLRSHELETTASVGIRKCSRAPGELEPAVNRAVARRGPFL